MTTATARAFANIAFIKCALARLTGPLFLRSNIRLRVGASSLLMALPPVIVLPISYFVYKEKIGWQAVIGTGLAIAGVAVLFLV